VATDKTNIELKLNYDHDVNQGGLSASCNEVIRNLDNIVFLVMLESCTIIVVELHGVFYDIKLALNTVYI